LTALIFALLIGLALDGPGAQQATWQPAPGHTQISIWPAAVPDQDHVARPDVETMRTRPTRVAGQPWVEVGHVSRPTMTVYSPAAGDTGAAVVVFPGGGYQILAIDLEGTEVCDWLTSRGITCVLSKYRVPGDGLTPRSGAYPNSRAALQDAQRTVRLVRLHAPEWHIDPRKIGVLGFSAGGHLVAAVSTNFEKRLYPAVDRADSESCRPDFAVALYPGHLLEHTEKDLQLNPYVPVTSRTPPTFLLQAEDDPVDDVKNSLVYFAALKKAGALVEMHLYAQGGHAFGLRRTRLPITGWPDLVEAWLRTIGMISNQHTPAETEPGARR
jgi:acetyl esterase/lipase